MRRPSLLLLLTIFICGLAPTIALADGLPGLPLPEPRITESTVIQGTGWSRGRSRNESLSCEIAYTRAMAQLSKGIDVARTKHLMTSDELAHALPLTMLRSWNPDMGRCTVNVRIEIPVHPRSSIPVLHDRLY